MDEPDVNGINEGLPLQSWGKTKREKYSFPFKKRPFPGIFTFTFINAIHIQKLPVRQHSLNLNEPEVNGIKEGLPLQSWGKTKRKIPFLEFLTPPSLMPSTFRNHEREFPHLQFLLQPQ